MEAEQPEQPELDLNEMAAHCAPRHLTDHFGLDVTAEDVQRWLADGRDPVVASVRVYEVTSRGGRGSKIGETLAADEATYDAVRSMCGTGLFQLEFHDVAGGRLTTRRVRLLPAAPPPQPAPEPEPEPEYRAGSPHDMLLLEIMRELRELRRERSAPATREPVGEAVAALVSAATASNQLILGSMQSMIETMKARENDPVRDRLIARALEGDGGDKSDPLDMILRLKELGQDDDMPGWARMVADQLDSIKPALALWASKDLPPDDPRLLALLSHTQAESE